MADVRGDENCFFRAIAHQLCYNEFHHEQIRQSAVKEVIENPERYRNFVTEGLDKYVSSLSTNREWANNTAIQATAKALGISIEIINNPERIPSYTVIPCEVESNQNISTSFLVTLAMFIMWQQNFKKHLLQHHRVGGFLNPQKSSSTLALLMVH